MDCLRRKPFQMFLPFSRTLCAVPTKCNRCVAGYEALVQLGDSEVLAEVRDMSSEIPATCRKTRHSRCRTLDPGSIVLDGRNN